LFSLPVNLRFILGSMAFQTLRAVFARAAQPGFVLGLLAGALFGCQPPSATPVAAPPVAASPPDVIVAAPPLSAAPAVAPPPPVADGTTVKDEFALSAGATLPQQSLDCVTGVDPELDKESPWSKETGERLDRQLERLAPCTRGLPPGDTELTLRMVYGPDGFSTSQHVVRSSAAGCDVSACVMRELAQIPSPKLSIDRASYDISLVLQRGSARRAPDAPEVLAEDPEDTGGGSCVDPAITALSRAKIREVVSTTFTDLKQCYGQALMRDHAVTGNVTFEFVIGQGGKVARAQIREATLPDCAAIQCMLAEFRGLEFPAPIGRSVRIVYPIRYMVEQAPSKLQ
jgi:hypothetical protein